MKENACSAINARRDRASKLCRLGLGLGLATSLSLLALPVVATGQEDHLARRDEPAQQAVRVWDDSLQRDTEGVFSLLRSIAGSGGKQNALESRILSESADHYLDDLGAQAKDRLTAYEESLTKLEEEVAKGNLREALAAALGAHESGLANGELLALMPGTGLPFQKSILADPRVTDLITSSEVAAHDAEKNGRWLEAQDLFYRLNSLVDRAYDEDLTRVSNRLGLLRLYVPQRLEDLMIEHFERIGEDPPPRNQNPELDTWRTHLDGINVRMVRDALRLSANLHLSQTGYGKLLTGGFRAMDTMATTHDLAIEFDGLNDEQAVQRFLTYVREEARYWENQPEGVDRQRAFEAVDRLLAVNKTSIHLPKEAILHEFGDGTITVLDRFTDLIWPDELAMFQRQLQGSFMGVGIQIIIDERNQLMVVTPLKGSPAYFAGIRANDDIVAVDGRSTIGITSQQAINQITGPRGTEVVLTIRRKDVDEPFDVPVKRDRIPLETVKGWELNDDNTWNYFINPEARIGYIRLTGFVRQTVTDFDMAVAHMGPDLNGLVIDLRFNPGGQLQAVIDLCNRFVDQGIIVSTEGPGRKRTRVHRAMAHRANAQLSSIPVVVLINQGSASASEIMAGCLRDHDRAVVVGTRSFGKGSVQQIFDSIDSGKAMLRITREHYLLPNGDMIHREPKSTQWGVEPHLEVRMTPEQVRGLIEVYRDVDIIPDPKVGWTDEDRQRRDPSRLLTEQIDTQLETAMVLLQCRLWGTVSDTALALPDRVETMPKEQ